MLVRNRFAHLIATKKSNFSLSIDQTMYKKEFILPFFYPNPKRREWQKKIDI